MGAATSNVGIGGQVVGNTGLGLKSADSLITTISKPIKDGDDFEELTSFEVDPSSTSQNLFTALRLVLQALKSVPVFTYISFLLSLLFLILYLKPFNSLFSSSSAPQLVLTQQHRHRHAHASKAKEGRLSPSSRQRSQSQRRRK